MADGTGWNDDCLTCIEGIEGDDAPRGECPNSRFPCGHHDNCTWYQDCCHWCGAQCADDGITFVVPDRCGVFKNSHVSPHRGCVLR